MATGGLLLAILPVAVPAAVVIAGAAVFVGGAVIGAVAGMIYLYKDGTHNKDTSKTIEDTLKSLFYPAPTFHGHAPGSS